MKELALITCDFAGDVTNASSRFTSRCNWYGREVFPPQKTGARCRSKKDPTIPVAIAVDHVIPIG